MKLEQFVGKGCWIVSTFETIDAVKQNITLVLSDTARDEEKASVVAKVTNELVQRGWVIADTQNLGNAVTVVYTKLAGPIELVETILSC